MRSALPGFQNRCGSLTCAPAAARWRSALARELPSAQICATDISPAALAIARGNAEAHHVAARMQFFTGDLFEALVPRRGGSISI